MYKRAPSLKPPEPEHQPKSILVDGNQQKKAVDGAPKKVTFVAEPNLNTENLKKDSSPLTIDENLESTRGFLSLHGFVDPLQFVDPSTTKSTLKTTKDFKGPPGFLGPQWNPILDSIADIINISPGGLGSKTMMKRFKTEERMLNDTDAYVTHRQIQKDDILVGPEFKDSTQRGNVDLKDIIQEEKNEYREYGQEHGNKTKLTENIVMDRVKGRFVKPCMTPLFVPMHKREGRWYYVLSTDEGRQNVRARLHDAHSTSQELKRKNETKRKEKVKKMKK